MFVHKYTYKRSIQLIKILTNHSLRSIHCNVWFIITSFKLLRHFFLSHDLFLFSAFSMCFFPSRDCSLRLTPLPFPVLW